jgi:2-aminoethylphosphonate-pyruvate transaminase
VVEAARDALADMNVSSATPPAAALEERKKLAA